MSDYEHPYETVNLPSGGRFYPEGHPLRYGTIDIKYLTAKEEDILTSTNLISKGLVFDKLLDSIIMTKWEDGKRIKVEDILIGDIDAILVSARVLAYGKAYSVQNTCPQCGATVPVNVDLSSLDSKEVNVGEVSEEGTFDFKLNESITVTLRLLTRGDEKRYKKELKSLDERHLPTTEITSRLRSIVVAVNGDTDRSVINEFCTNMLISDSRKLREYYAEVVPGIDFKYDFPCQNCRAESEGWVAVGPNFFWPDL